MGAHGRRPRRSTRATRCSPGSAPIEVVGEARPVVEHYIRYAGPIRMAQRCGDLPNALEIRLLDCQKDTMADGKVVEAEFSNLPELTREVRRVVRVT